MDNLNLTQRILLLVLCLTVNAMGQGARTSFPLYEKGITNYHEGWLFATNATGKILVRTADEPFEAVNYQQLTSSVSAVSLTSSRTGMVYFLPPSGSSTSLVGQTIPFDLWINGSVSITGNLDVVGNTTYTVVETIYSNYTHIVSGTNYINETIYSTNINYTIFLSPVATNTIDVVGGWIFNNSYINATNASWVGTPNFISAKSNSTLTAWGTWDFTGATVAGITNGLIGSVTGPGMSTSGGAVTFSTNGWSFGSGSGDIHSLSNNVFNPVGFTNRFFHTVVVDNLVETGGVMRVTATNNSYGVVLRFDHFTNGLSAWTEAAPSTNWVANFVGATAGITITNDASQPAGVVVGGSPGTTFGIGTAGGGGGGSVNILTNDLVAIPATTNINFLTTSNSVVLVTNNAISIVPTMLFATNSVSGHRAEMRLALHNASTTAGLHFRSTQPGPPIFNFDTGCDFYQFGATNWTRGIILFSLFGPFWQQLVQSTSVTRYGGWEYRVGSPAANIFTFGYMNSAPATNDYAVISCMGNPSMLLLSPTVINGDSLVSPRQPGKVNLGFHVVTIWTNINPHGLNAGSSSPQHELQWYTRVGPIFPARQHYTIVGSNLTGVAFGRSHGLANDDAIFPTNRFGEVFFGTFGTATSNVVGFAGRDETNGLWYAYLSTNGNWITTYTRP